MSVTLPRLRQDHKNVLLVLLVIEDQINIVAKAGKPDFELLGDITSYFQHYLTLFHQPKEDLIFGHLVCEIPNFQRDVLPLLEEHRELVERIGNFESAAKSLELEDQSWSREAFCKAGHFFVSRQREHVDAEEKCFYPDAERWLTAEQWAEVDRYLPTERDPLSSEILDTRFVRLIRAMEISEGSAESKARSLNDYSRLRQALSRWDNEGGAAAA